MPLNCELQSGYIYVNFTSITFLRKHKKPEEKQEDKKKSKVDVRTPTRKQCLPMTKNYDQNSEQFTQCHESIFSQR